MIGKVGAAGRAVDLFSAHCDYPERYEGGVGKAPTFSGFGNHALIQPMQASFGSVDVTPAHPIPLCGFADRLESYSKIHSAIEVNAVVLRHDNRILVLVSGDFLCMTASIRDRLLAAFGDKCGISRADILLAASHTFFAPALDRTKAHLGSVDPDYLRLVEERIETLVGSLLASGEPSSIRHHRLVSRHNISQRVLAIDADGVKSLDAAHCDPGGPCDPRLDLLRFDNERGFLSGVIVRYSCPPLSFPDRLELSAEYPGVIRERLRASTGQADLPVLFLQGYAAQTRPMTNRFRAGGLASSASASLEIVPRSEFTGPIWDKWAASLAADVYAALLAAAEQPALVPSLQSTERPSPFANLMEEFPVTASDAEMSLQAMAISADVLLVAIGAAPSSGWTEAVSDLLPGKMVIPVGYANHVCGDLPTAREAIQGLDDGALLTPGRRYRAGFAETLTVQLAALLAPYGEPAAASYRERIATLRRRIDDLLTERDEARAMTMQAREAQKAGDEHLEGLRSRADNLDEAAANLRRLLHQARPAT